MSDMSLCVDVPGHDDHQLGGGGEGWGAEDGAGEEVPGGVAVGGEAFELAGGGGVDLCVRPGERDVSEVSRIGSRQEDNVRY